MEYEFINHRLTVAQGRWERAGFLRKWWGIYGSDRRWAPPPYGHLRRALNPDRNLHLARTDHSLIHMEAFRRRRRDAGSSDLAGSYSMPPAVFEEPVGALVLIIDPRRTDGTGYLGLLRTINDVEILEQLFFSLTEQLWQRGCRRVIGPVGLSPLLGSGALHDHFHITPPLYSAYNPPYFSDLLAGTMDLEQQLQMYRIDVNATRPETPPAGIKIVTRPVDDLAGTLLPLFQASCADQRLFPAPDEDEARFLVSAVARFPVVLRVVQQGDHALGFALLGADHAELLRRARGSRNPFRALEYAVRRRNGVDCGRLFFGGVAPDARGQGLGRLVWTDTLATAHERGWQSLAIGPVVVGSPAARFLEQTHARPEQSYGIYSMGL